MQRFNPCLIKLDQDDTPRFMAAAHKVLAHPWSHLRSKPDIEQFIHFRREEVPKQGSLSVEQCKAILIDFEASVLDKIRKRGVDFVTFMGRVHVNIAEFMHPFAWKLLRSFAALAPKDREGIHPLDRIHFLQFVAVLHLTGHRLDPHHFGGWLREQGFTSDASSALQDEFDYHLELLKIYDQIGKSKEAHLAKQSQL